MAIFLVDFSVEWPPEENNRWKTLSGDRDELNKEYSGQIVML